MKEKKWMKREERIQKNDKIYNKEKEKQESIKHE